MDQGGEFKGPTAKLLEAHGVTIERSQAGHHRSQAFVEAFNKALAQRLFKQMNARGDDYWVQDLQETTNAMNNEETALIKLKPADAIRQEQVTQPTLSPEKLALVNKKKIPMGATVRYLLARDDTGDGKRRATDRIWSSNLYEVTGFIPEPGQPDMYQISGPVSDNMNEADMQKITSKQHWYTRLHLQVTSKS
jgi:hypothetical protein